jgi:hypothetical protein
MTKSNTQENTSETFGYIRAEMSSDNITITQISGDDEKDPVKIDLGDKSNRSQDGYNIKNYDDFTVLSKESGKDSLKILIYPDKNLKIGSSEGDVEVIDNYVNNHKMKDSKVIPAIYRTGKVGFEVGVTIAWSVASKLLYNWFMENIRVPGDSFFATSVNKFLSDFYNNQIVNAVSYIFSAITLAASIFAVFAYNSFKQGNNDLKSINDGFLQYAKDNNAWVLGSVTEFSDKWIKHAKYPAEKIDSFVELVVKNSKEALGMKK